MFTELHTSSAFSFLRGASLPETLITRAAELGYPALALLDADGVYATRAQVKLGRSSVNAIEIVSGLQPGDKVILSDMSQWETSDRIKLN